MSVWGAEGDIVYTLTCKNNTSNTAYATYKDVTINEKTWNAPGNQNAAANTDKWRIGGGAITDGARQITGKSSIDNIIGKITVNHGGRSNTNITIHSFSVIVAADAAFSNVVETVTINNPDVANAGSFDLEPTSVDWPTGCYYQFDIKYTKTGSGNSGLDLTSIVFYEGADLTPGEVAAPSFSLSAGAVKYGASLTLTQEDVEMILYTTDGTDPSYENDNGELYTNPISITTAVTIKAIAVDDEGNESAVATTTYTIKTPSAPTFSKTGEVKEGTSITLSQADDETIIYTTDGTAPTWEPLNGAEYSSPIPVADEMTIKAIAVDGAESVSAVSEATYSIVHGVTIAGRKITFDFSVNSAWEFPLDNYVLTEQTYSSDGYSITMGESSNGHKLLGSGIIMGKADATLSLPAFDFDVHMIKVYGQSGASGKVTMNIYVGETAVSDEAKSSLEDHEFAIASNKQSAGTIYTFKVTNANNAQITKIEVFGKESVTISSVGWATFSSENALDFTNVSGLTAYLVEGVTGTTLDLSDAQGKVPASTGLLLNGAADTYNIPIIASASAVGTNKLVACTTETVLTTNAGHYVLVDDGGAVFQNLSENGATIPAGKAYLNLAGAGAPERLRIVAEENNATGVENVETGEKVVKFIENGKLYIHREGVTYDAMGRMVK